MQPSAQVCGQSGLSGRTVANIQYDSNINELPDGSSAFGLDLLATLAFRQDTRRRASGTEYLQWQLQSNTNLYARHSSSSRSLNHLTARYNVPIQQGFRIQPLVKAESKNYIEGNRNYYVLGGGFHGILTTRKRYFASVEYVRSKVLFTSFHDFNNLSDVVSVSVGRNIDNLEYLSLKAIAGNHQYSKSALSSQTELHGIRQRDNTFGYGASGAFFVRSIMVQANYLYMIVSSNSYGSSLNLHKVDVLLLGKIRTGLFLKLYGATEFRDYSEKGFIAEDITAYQLGMDNKALVMEIGRMVGESLEIRLRYHWYRNQALLKRQYYSRSVLALGLEKRL